MTNLPPPLVLDKFVTKFTFFLFQYLLYRAQEMKRILYYIDMRIPCNKMIKEEGRRERSKFGAGMKW
jgi:hypothetical protein